MDSEMQNVIINNIEFSAGIWPLNPNLNSIVFLHGSGGTNILWQHQVEALSDKINTIAVIGAGNMGSGIAQKMAQEGLNVVMVDIKEEFVQRGLATITNTLAEAIERKIFSQAQIDEILSQDESAPRKQRHTAVMIHRRLQENGFEGFLVGEQFMKQENPAEGCAEFVQALLK